MTDIKIERLGALGDGISGGAFYPLTLPGERIDPGPPLRILDPSEQRVSPPCKHFGTCGGCSVQHASDDFLARWKQDLVQRAIGAHGLEAPYRATQTSPPYSRRRATLTVRRTRKTVQIGFQERGSDSLVDLQACSVMRPEILALRPLLTRLAGLGGSRNGVLKAVATLAPAGVDLSVTGGKPLDRPLRAELAQAASPLARLTWNTEAVAQRDPPMQPIGQAWVLPPPGAFLQATAEGATALTAAVQEAVGSAARVADLFSGIGTFALPLAEAAQVLAVEGDAEMTAALDQAWRKAKGLRTVSAQTRDLFRRPLVPLELNAFDAVVLDPPRAGAAAQIAQLADSTVPIVVMVSCNPVSFARDAAVLVGAGYKLDWIQIVDQFRWTGHVELVARLSRTDAPPGR